MVEKEAEVDCFIYVLFVLLSASITFSHGHKKQGGGGDPMAHSVVRAVPQSNCPVATATPLDQSLFHESLFK